MSRAFALTNNPAEGLVQPVQPVEPNTFTYPLPLGFSYASGLSASQPFPGKPANFFIPQDRRPNNTGASAGLGLR